MTIHIRAGALALAGMTVVLASPLASNDRTAHAEPGPASPAHFAPLVPLDEVGGEALTRSARRPVPGSLGRRVARLARAALRAQSARPHFPVRGEFNWGQGGARFGASRSGRSHEGQDLFARTGAPLVAIRDGVIIESGNDGGRGNYVALYAPSVRRTYVYLHMNAPARVKVGERTHGGQRLGEVGCTGSCFGDHLHFEVRRGRAVAGEPQNPLPLLTRWAKAGRARPTLAPGQS